MNCNSESRFKKMMVKAKQIVGTVFFAMLMFVGCNGIVEQKPAVVTGSKWVIFSGEYAQRKAMHRGIWFLSSGAVDGYWTPTEDEIKELEDKLVDYLQQNADEFNQQPPIWERVDGYKRQYIGVQSDGVKMVYGNYFCSDHSLAWQEELLDFLDGGECYFQILYDAQSEQFMRLAVNGEA